MKRGDWLPYALLLVYAVAPLLPGFGYTAAGLMVAHALGAMGVALLMGHAGLVSFGHGLFYAAAAYTIGLMLKYGVARDMLVLLAAGVAAAGLAAMAAGVVAVKHRGVYFAMVTLALGQLLYAVLIQFYSITGGSDGLPIHDYTIAGVSLENADVRSRIVYYIGLGLLAAAVYLYSRLLSSPFGHALRAVRDDEYRAEALGLSPRRMLWLAFVASGLLTGLGGAIDAFTVEHITPIYAYWTFSGTLVFIALLGGVATAAGPLLGALVYEAAFTTLYSVIPEYWRATLGAVMLLIVFAAAGGLEGIVERVRRKLGV